MLAVHNQLDTFLSDMKPLLPYTGKEFLDSLGDGREVWIYGERVHNIDEHPAFRNTARMLARLYDALHRDHADEQHLLTCPTEWGGLTRRYFAAPRSAEELVAARDVITAWSRLSYGWLGRSPDYKAAFLATLGANAEFYAPYEHNAHRWYRYSQQRMPFVNHAIVQPPVDRNMPPGAPGGRTDIYVHVTKETDAGIRVTGAKVVATGSALTHYTFVAHAGRAAGPGATPRASNSSAASPTNSGQPCSAVRSITRCRAASMKTMRSL